MSRIVPRIVFSSRGEVELDEIEIYDPAQNQILVGVRKTQVNAGSERNSLENEHGEDRYRYPRPTGYTSVGVVEAIGADVKGYVEGDRVLILSPHQGAALVEVDPRGHPDQSYAGKVPDDVTDSQATFAILGDVALHCVRRARPCVLRQRGVGGGRGLRQCRDKRGGARTARGGNERVIP